MNRSLWLLLPSAPVAQPGADEEKRDADGQRDEEPGHGVRW